MSETTLAGFETRAFSHDGKTLPVFHGGVGPGVVIIHEIPGITPEVTRFARWVVDAGFHVAMPSLFGTPGKPKTTGYLIRSFARACISREFTCWLPTAPARSPTGCGPCAERSMKNAAVPAWARSACA